GGWRRGTGDIHSRTKAWSRPLPAAAHARRSADWKRPRSGSISKEGEIVPSTSAALPSLLKEAIGMAEQIRCDDGAAYEQFMGIWSRMVGDAFLSWLAPVSGQRWLDVGCGNGAFSELIVQRCSPSEVQGIDPSAEQVTYAQNRLTAGPTHFRC